MLFLDVLRQRGNNYFERAGEEAPTVLNFQFERVMSGRDLPRPVNCGLVRIVPPADVRIDPRKQPFIVFDPRAGQGPGIGGMLPIRQGLPSESGCSSPTFSTNAASARQTSSTVWPGTGSGRKQTK